MSKPKDKRQKKKRKMSVKFQTLNGLTDAFACHPSTAARFPSHVRPFFDLLLKIAAASVEVSLQNRDDLAVCALLLPLLCRPLYPVQCHPLLQVQDLPEIALGFPRCQSLTQCLLHPVLLHHPLQPASFLLQGPPDSK